MSNPVITSAARTAIGTSYKRSLANVSSEEFAIAVLTEVVRQADIAPELVKRYLCRK